MNGTESLLFSYTGSTFINIHFLTHKSNIHKFIHTLYTWMIPTCISTVEEDKVINILENIYAIKTIKIVYIIDIMLNISST